jgi:hypothetical protein
MNLTAKEQEKVRFLLSQRERLNASGNFCDKFSEQEVGSALFRKLQSAGWLEWTGFLLLPMRDCFCLSEKGIREAGLAIKSGAKT